MVDHRLDTKFLDQLPKLAYVTDEGSRSLPEWAMFFLHLGYLVAGVPTQAVRHVFGLALPTRTFASGLIATGIVARSIELGVDQDWNYIDYISSLSPGTSVCVRRGNQDVRQIRGVVEGFQEIRGKDNIIVRVSMREILMLPLETYAERITPLHNDEIRLPKQIRRGRKVSTPSPFVECYLGTELAQRLVFSSETSVLLVGQVSAIKREVCDVRFVCRRSGRYDSPEGVLNDLLRVRQFQAVTETYRTQCLKQSDKYPERKLGNKVPPIVVFDGAVAFLNHGNQWASSHQIVLLDRTETQFDDAVTQLNQRYSYRASDTTEIGLEVPTGIEMMVFDEACS